MPPSSNYLKNSTVSIIHLKRPRATSLMSQPTTMQEAAYELSCTFELITGLRPRVALNATREADGSRLVAVGYPGDELVRAMQIEAFVVEKGDRIHHRSQQRNGLTVLAYYIMPRTAPAPRPTPTMGGFHLSTVKPPRVVPGHERHRWLIKKLLRGQSTTCDKCGCKKTLTRDYETRYHIVGAKFDTELRPDCTGVPPTTPTA